MPRMFVALRPPPDAIEDLDAFLEARRSAADFRWTVAEHLHVTLAFFADVPDSRLDGLLERLETATSRRTPISAAVAGGGAFPDPARGRVLYAGLALDEPDAGELDRLAVGCRNAASTAGVPVDGQAFTPHLTVARCGGPTELTRWIRLLDAYRGPSWIADEVVLVASHLGEGPRKRPRYDDVARFAL